MKFSGTGTLVYNEELSLKADIEFYWDSNQFSKKPMIKINAVSKEQGLIYGYHKLPFFPWNLSGKTSEGIKYWGEGLALISRGEQFNTDREEVSLGFSCNVLKINSDIDQFQFIEFYVPNVFIGFDQYEKVGKNSTLNISNFDLDYRDAQYNITLSGLNESVLKKSDIIYSGEDTLTLKVTIRNNSGDIHFFIAEEIMEILTDIISIIYGDTISWIHGIGYNKDGQKVSNILRDLKYSNLNVIRQLIDIRFSYRLTSYIKKTFPVYATFDENKKKSLKKLSQGIQFSQERLVFPAPFFSLGSCIEDFVNYAIPDIESHYVTKAQRRSVDPMFASWIKENIEPLLKESDKEDFNDSALKQKLSALIQRNLRSRISKLLECYKIDYEKTWVSDFVKKRNEAAHGNYSFNGLDDFIIWTRMASLLERIILKEVGFTGDYIDWSENPPVNKELL